MKKYIIKIKEGFVFSITASIVFIFIGIIYASLNSVEPGDMLTAEKWNELVGKVNNLDSINGNYSTGETFTGNYWIDGKPIYRKIIIANGPGKDIKLEIPHNIIDRDNIIKLYSICIHKENRNSFFKPDNKGILGVIGDNVVIQVNQDETNYRYYTTIEYTKTTD